MGPESNDDGLLAPFPGERDHRLKQMTVPEMDTVKKACRYYSHLTHSKSCLCGSSAFFANTRAPTW